MLDAWALKKLVRRMKEFTRATTMEANGVNVFKSLAFGLGREQRNLALTNRVWKETLGRDDRITCMFWKNLTKGSLV